MAIMLAKTYQALKAAGAPEEDAVAAAEELADYENRLSGIDNRLSVMDGWFIAIEGRLAGIEGKLAVVIWAVGINGAATIAILGVLLRSHGPL
jgi:hypothetical protein